MYRHQGPVSEKKFNKLESTYSEMENFEFMVSQQLIWVGTINSD